MATAQTTTGTMIPTRSASLPIRMLATPNEIMVSVYGNDASPRATPNSAWTAGSATTTDHIPTPPMVESARVTARRNHAYGESASPYCTRSFTSRLCHERVLAHRRTNRKTRQRLLARRSLPCDRGLRLLLLLLLRLLLLLVPVLVLRRPDQL